MFGNNLKMKTSLLILMGFIHFTWLIGQDNKLIDFSYKSFQIENADKNSCIISDSLNDKGWKIAIFSQGQCDEINGFVNIVNDTIDFSFGIPTIPDTTYYKYDSLTGVTTLFMETRNGIRCCSGVCGYELTYLVNKMNKNKKIRINGNFISKCTDRSDFQIIQGDTINRHDKYGFKQGDWFDFYPNMMVKELKNYDHDRWISGFGYDEKGKQISKSSRSGSLMVTILEKQQTNDR